MKTVRMQYLGNEERYSHGANFRAYRGSQWHKFADVHIDDVASLIESGLWSEISPTPQALSKPQLSEEIRADFLQVIRSLTGSPIVVLASESYEELADIMLTAHENPTIYSASDVPSGEIDMLFLGAGQVGAEHLIDSVKDGGIVVLHNRRRPARVSPDAPKILESNVLDAYMVVKE